MEGKILNISIVDENTIKVVGKLDGKYETYIISEIEGDKASTAVMNEVKKLIKVLNTSVLKTLDKTQSFSRIKAEKLQKDISENIENTKREKQLKQKIEVEKDSKKSSKKK